ncbi:hypothetical protein KO317_01490 [Candidatus Micrarchaeota archaeon]|nr:hypothetical protein [Candidatus Micrarchaeota archaeon]
MPTPKVLPVKLTEKGIKRTIEFPVSKTNTRDPEKQEIFKTIQDFCFKGLENLEEIDRIIEKTEGLEYKKQLLEYLAYEVFPCFAENSNLWPENIQVKRDTLAHFIYFNIRRLIDRYFEKEEKERLFTKINADLHEFDQLI